MSKIKIKSKLNSKNNNYSYNGAGIKNKNTIIYNDNNVITKITIDNIIKIIRKSEYTLTIRIKKGVNLEGKYITNYGTLKVETYTKELIIKTNYLKAIYELRINNEYIDTFTYILEYSIDS